jgi:predicted transcriptional regulator
MPTWDKTNRSVKCDCGNLKSWDRGACERCEFLDGARGSDFELIQCLREANIATIAELAYATGRPRESVHRTLKRLREKGRIGVMRPTDGMGPGGSGAPGFVYKLVDEGAA